MLKVILQADNWETDLEKSLKKIKNKKVRSSAKELLT